MTHTRLKNALAVLIPHTRIQRIPYTYARASPIDYFQASTVLVIKLAAQESRVNWLSRLGMSPNVIAPSNVAVE